MLTVQNVELQLGGRTIIHHLSLHIHKGDFFVILGGNGSGKTSLLELMSGFQKPTHGKVFLGSSSSILDLSNLSPKTLAQKIAFIDQETTPVFNITVHQLVTMGRYPHLNRTMKLTDTDRAIIHQAMQSTDVNRLKNISFQSLSHGEKVRARLACALAQQPQLLLLDEPIAHLDIKYQSQLITLFKRLAHEQGISVVCTLHELQWATHANQVGLLHQGQLLTVGSPSEVLTPSWLNKAYQTN